MEFQPVSLRGHSFLTYISTRVLPLISPYIDIIEPSLRQCNIFNSTELPSDKASVFQGRRCKRRKFNPLDEEMATHSSILTWKIPWTQEPGGLPPAQRVAESDTTEWLSTHTFNRTYSFFAFLKHLLYHLFAVFIH